MVSEEWLDINLLQCLGRLYKFGMVTKNGDSSQTVCLIQKLYKIDAQLNWILGGVNFDKTDGLLDMDAVAHFWECHQINTSNKNSKSNLNVKNCILPVYSTVQILKYKAWLCLNIYMNFDIRK